MASFGRTRFLALSGVLAFGACSLLAPSDDDLLGGPRVKNGAPDNPERSDAQRDVSQDVAFSDAADVLTPEDASADGTQPESGIDAADSAKDADTSMGDASDAALRCTDASDCATGSFCSLGRCRFCKDPSTLRNLSELEYGAPEPLTAVNDPTMGVHLRYPRAFDETTKLLYERDLFGGQIWLSPDMLQTPGTPLPTPVDVPNVTEAGALKFQPRIAPLAGFNFFYFAEVNHGDERSPFELFGATIDDFGFARGVTRLPAPFNAAPSAGRYNFSLALSDERAIWTTSTGGLLVQLVTARIGETTTSVLELPDADGCKLNQLEWGPWLAPSGRLLFFNAVERTADCNYTNPFPRDIYVVELDGSGMPAGPSAPLRGISKPGTTEVDGSLSFDQCWLYFSKDTAPGLRLFRARRIR